MQLLQLQFLKVGMTRKCLFDGTLNAFLRHFCFAVTLERFSNYFSKLFSFMENFLPLHLYAEL